MVAGLRIRRGGRVEARRLVHPTSTSSPPTTRTANPGRDGTRARGRPRVSAREESARNPTRLSDRLRLGKRQTPDRTVEKPPENLRFTVDFSSISRRDRSENLGENSRSATEVALPSTPGAVTVALDSARNRVGIRSDSDGDPLSGITRGRRLPRSNDEWPRRVRISGPDVVQGLGGSPGRPLPSQALVLPPALLARLVLAVPAVSPRHRGPPDAAGRWS